MIKLLFAFLRSLPWTIYFNFHYLPFNQAIKLPILLYKPKLLCCKGLVSISGGVKFGMIRLGFNQVSIYPNSGIIWENRGKIIFKGGALIGNNSAISVGKTGLLTFGNRFRASASFKCICYNRITFETDVLIGWDCLISDTDFHTLQINNHKTNGYGNIHIGANNWIAMQSLILKGTHTPQYSVISARTLTSNDYCNSGEKILIAGIPGKVVKNNVYHDYNNDTIDYNSN